MSRARLAAALLAPCFALLPATAGAQVPPQGVFQPDVCTNDPFNDGRLTVRGMELRFWESGCALSNPVAVRGMEGAHLYDAECSGEGEIWSTRYLMMPGREGRLVFVQPQYATVYEYCGPGDGAPAPGGATK